jgi:hypothetical protein
LTRMTWWEERERGTRRMPAPCESETENSKVARGAWEMKAGKGVGRIDALGAAGLQRAEHALDAIVTEMMASMCAGYGSRSEDREGRKRHGRVLSTAVKGKEGGRRHTVPELD